MATIVRRIAPRIMRDLSIGKMVTIAGPRQCGKTTLTDTLPVPSGSKAYYNWDIDAHRKCIRGSELDESKEYWVFDEIHKYTRWRNWLKGIYDLHRHTHRILVTGSARLDLYSRGGDSLQGRYFSYRLHPLTLAEVLGVAEYEYLQFPSLSPARVLSLAIDDERARSRLEHLLTFGGFPEPFTVGSPEFTRRWSSEYAKRLVNEEVRTLEQTVQIDQMALLYERLPELIANELSVNKLALDLEVANQTASKWIYIFEKLYGCFRIPPFVISTKGAHNAKIRVVKRARKLYLWDWTRISELGARVENLAAAHLLRMVHWFEDAYGESLDLRYFRDVEGHEVDFVVLRNKQPWLAIEIKSSAQALSAGMKYFLERVKVQFAFQLHLKGDTDTRIKDVGGAKVRLMPLHRFLALLP